MPAIINRRRFERFCVAPMYTGVSVRRLDDPRFTFEGHAYDISEAGIRFELDRRIDPGTRVALQVELPGLDAGGPGRAVFAFGTVIWTADETDEPGPVRMAVAFTSFARAGDRERLWNALSSGRYARAA